MVIGARDFFCPSKPNSASLARDYHLLSSLTFDELTSHPKLVPWMSLQGYFLVFSTCQSSEMVRIGFLTQIHPFLRRKDLCDMIKATEEWTTNPLLPKFLIMQQEKCYGSCPFGWNGTRQCICARFFLLIFWWRQPTVPVRSLTCLSHNIRINFLMKNDNKSLKTLIIILERYPWFIYMVFQMLILLWPYATIYQLHYINSSLAWRLTSLQITCFSR